MNQLVRDGLAAVQTQPYPMISMAAPQRAFSLIIASSLIVANSGLFAQTQKTAVKDTGYKAVIIPAADGTWGYDILQDGKLLIHQPNIPAAAGNNGFRDKAVARRVAGIVIAKMRNGQMPPTLTIEELRKADAIR